MTSVLRQKIVFFYVLPARNRCAQVNATAQGLARLGVSLSTLNCKGNIKNPATLRWYGEHVVSSCTICNKYLNDILYLLYFKTKYPLSSLF